MSKDILGLYHQGNINDLCKCNLAGKLDSDGNTILHIIAVNLDQNTLQKMNQLVPSKLRENINIANNHGELPLHKALDSVEKTTGQDDTIITYLINELGANPNIPDNKNRIIVPLDDLSSLTSPTTPTTSLHGNIMKLNDNIVKNILELSKLNGSDLKTLYQHSESPSMLSDQLRNIFGKRSGAKTEKQLQFENKQLQFANKKSSISTYMGNEHSDKLEFIKSLVKLYRSNDLEEENKKQEMWGGFDDFDNSDSDQDFNGFDMYGGYKGRRKISSYVSENDDFKVDNPNGMLGMLAMQDRPKMDPQIFAENNEIYKEIIQKIKSQLGVTDEIAKTIAAYLKIQVKKDISETNPDKMDREKLDKVKEIVNDKDNLDAQYNKMKKDELFEEIQKNREERQKRREEHNAKDKTKGKAIDSSDNKSDTSDKEAEEKPKKKRVAKKTAKADDSEQSRISNAKRKIASTGYLQSDEMIFSPDY